MTDRNVISLGLGIVLEFRFFFRIWIKQEPPVFLTMMNIDALPHNILLRQESK